MMRNLYIKKTWCVSSVNEKCEFFSPDGKEACNYRYMYVTKCTFPDKYPERNGKTENSMLAKECNLEACSCDSCFSINAAFLPVLDTKEVATLLQFSVKLLTTASLKFAHLKCFNYLFLEMYIFNGKLNCLLL